MTPDEVYALLMTSARRQPHVVAAARALARELGVSLRDIKLQALARYLESPTGVRVSTPHGASTLHSDEASTRKK